MANQEILLEARNITKRFPGCVALDNVDFDVHPGEVHVLFGENGAGKTTLVKILTGVYPPDEGEVYIKGQPAKLESSHHARSLGVSAVYQEFSLVPGLSIIANLFLGREFRKGLFLNKNTMAKQAYSYLKKLKFSGSIDLEEQVANLSLADQQIIEIAKGLTQDVSVVILDEPTSALSGEEIEVLFDIVKRLVAEGKGVIYISHIMDEIRDIGDRVTILRDGKKVSVLTKREEITEKNLIKSIVPDASEEIWPKLGKELPEKLLEVKNLSTKSGLKDISFDLRAGEILGVAGLPDSGKSALGRAIFGLDHIIEGDVTIFGEKIATKRWTPSQALNRNLFYSPADKLEGLILCRDIKENQALPSLREKFESRGFITAAEERKAVNAQIKNLGIKPPDMGKLVGYLSGGNQQKVIVARGFLKEARIFIFDEVTRGIDVGAKRDIYRLIAEIAKQGVAILYISSEIPELLNLCHSVITMHELSIFKRMKREDATRDKLAHHLFGLDIES
jgi:ribose transport system ATP-binding protein